MKLRQERVHLCQVFPLAGSSNFAITRSVASNILQQKSIDLQVVSQQ